MKRFIIFLLIIFLTGCAAKPGAEKAAQPEGGDMPLSGKKVLMVIAPKDFRDAEYTEPRKVIEASGAEVKTASIQSGVAVGAEGTKVQIDLTVSQANVEDYEAVAFIGGPGMVEIISDDSLQVLARKFYEAGKLTAAICVAPAILAKAGILSGKRATAWSGAKSDLEAGGADYTGESVAVDGKIITASGPAAGREFGEKIVEGLE